MHPLIGNASEQTWLVVFALVIYILVTVKPRQLGIFPKVATASIKGVAMLLIVFGHIGYFFISDHAFLPPLSNFAGIGVDMFLLVSGLGLMISNLNRPLSIGQFYKRRLIRVYLPVLGSVALLILLDFIFLHRTYPLSLNIKNLLGFFPQADIFNDVNSPLWFITPILVYYLVWPLVFWKRAPVILPMVFVVLAYLQFSDWFLRMLPIAPGVFGLYKVHAWPFAIGTALGLFVWHLSRWYEDKGKLIVEKNNLVNRYGQFALFLVFAIGLSFSLMSVDVFVATYKIAFWSTIAALFFVGFIVTAPVSAVGLEAVGAASFLLYVIHTPLMTRYDFLFKYLPSGIATLVYLLGIMLIWRGYLKWREQRKLVVK